MGALAYVGAEQALKAQVPLLALVGFSLIALAVGAARALRWDVAIPLAPPSGEVGFWAGFRGLLPRRHRRDGRTRPVGRPARPGQLPAARLAARGLHRA